jgi:hypothetical protein
VNVVFVSFPQALGLGWMIHATMTFVCLFNLLPFLMYLLRSVVDLPWSISTYGL